MNLALFLISYFKTVLRKLTFCYNSLKEELHLTSISNISSNNRLYYFDSEAWYCAPEKELKFPREVTS